METEEEFIRRWSERAYDESQLAAMASIRKQIVDYARKGWRPLEIPPPRDKLLICACTDGLVLMRLTQLGDWRTSLGQPHPAPRAWMPAPLMPGEEDDNDVDNGSGGGKRYVRLIPV